MDIFSNLETFLYIASTILFYPVVVGLILLTFWVIISFGGFIREYFDRRKNPEQLSLEYNKYVQDKLLSLIPEERDNIDMLLEKLLIKEEQRLHKSIKKISFVIRVAPSLGLMGTLIPMGVALSSLSQGDMPAMAGNMVTAFTTTIVGLACGVMAYLISLIKEKWLEDDIRELEYRTELILRNFNK